MARMHCVVLLALLPYVLCQLVGSGYLATNFAPQPYGGSLGPIGLIFQRDGTFWVNNNQDGHIYHYSATGSLISQSTAAYPGSVRGMAFSKTEKLYICILPSSIVEWNKATNAAARTVISSGIASCLGMVCDPLSGDLFITDGGAQGKVFRLSNFESGSPVLQPYYQDASLGIHFDGIAVTPAGRFYLAKYGDQGGVYTISPSSVSPTVGSWVVSVPTMDGISVGVNLYDVEYPPFIICNNNDGTLKLVDLTTNPVTVDVILSGGSRGDFSVVGYDGCIYATQTDRVAKIADGTGACLNLYPTCPNRVPSLSFIPPNNENVTLGTNYCVQIHMADNVESLSWDCVVDWGDTTPQQRCTINQNPQTITLCHTYNQFYAGFLPVEVKVTDDQRFPAAIRKHIQLFHPVTPSGSGVTSTSTSSGVTSAGVVTGSGVTSAVSVTSAGSGVTSAGTGNTVVVTGAGSSVTGSGVSVSPAVTLSWSVCLILANVAITVFFYF